MLAGGTTGSGAVGPGFRIWSEKFMWQKTLYKISKSIQHYLTYLKPIQVIHKAFPSNSMTHAHFIETSIMRKGMNRNMVLFVWISCKT